MQKSLSCIIVLFLASCSYFSHKNIEAVPRYQDYTVAVLPLSNAANDINGQIVVRAIFHEKIKKYFSTKPLAEVDAVLKDRLGITLGAQVDITTPQQLGELLGVDGVIYGYLLNFDDITSGVYNARKVRAGFKLVDVKTGRIIWARGQGVKTVSGLTLLDVMPEDSFSSVKDLTEIPGVNEWQVMQQKTLEALLQAKPDEFIDASLETALTAIPLGSQIGEKIFDIHLVPETAFMVNKIVETLDSEKEVIIRIGILGALAGGGGGLGGGDFAKDNLGLTAYVVDMDKGEVLWTESIYKTKSPEGDNFIKFVQKVLEKLPAVGQQQ
ncbi:MAG: DUF799 family lipoprotein [Deltaproteobacteria bacterium]|nr:DUF799 family lipoprotein [Deltaproteobacteria bacterium]